MSGPKRDEVAGSCTKASASFFILAKY
jgi:hypothetical protein